MRARRTCERERCAARDREVAASERVRRDTDDAAQHVDEDDADGDRDDRGDRPATEEIEDREGEEVEADVQSEHVVLDTERHRVQPAKELVPLARACEAKEERGYEEQPHDAGRARERGAAGPLGIDDDARHLRPQREVEVRHCEDEEDEKERDERPEPRRVTAQVDVLEPEAAEPEEIGEERDERAEDDRDEKDEDEDDDDRDAPPRGRSRNASAATTELTDVEVLPVDVAPVGAAVPAPSHQREYDARMCTISSVSPSRA